MMRIVFSFLLKLIISKRPDQVNLPGERKKTPLHYAALIDNVEAAKILVNIPIFYYLYNKRIFYVY
jgi:ankyrin repeat protein